MKRIGIVVSISLVAALAALMSTGSPVAAAGIVVTTEFDFTTNDGRCSLREAITSANTNTASGNASGECPAGGASDTITMKAGPTIRVISKLPPITSGIVTIEGNGRTIFADAPLAVLEVRSPATVTVRDLTLTHRHSTSSVSGRGFYNLLGATSTLERVTIVDNSEVGYGGGIWNGGTMHVIDSVVTNNSNVPDGARVGGGIYNEHSATLTIVGSTISNNTSDRHGGGIYNAQGPDAPGDITITNSTITSNESSGGEGGGIYNSGTLDIAASTLSNNRAGPTGTEFPGGGLATFGPSVVSIANSTITGNDAREGAGVYNQSQMSIVNSELTRNTAAASIGTARGGGMLNIGEVSMSDVSIRQNIADQGGGIFVSGDAPLLDRLEILDNESTELGGGAVIAGSNVALTRTTLADNTSADLGGGALISLGATIANSTVSANDAAGAGGGIYVLDGAVVDFTTVTDNFAPIGAGVAVSGATPGLAQLTANIIAGNTGAGADVEFEAANPSDTAESGGYNVVGTVDARIAFDAPGDITGIADPGLEPLGPTLVHRPNPTSPAVARVPSSVTGSNGVDQRGALRSEFLRTAGAFECRCLSPFVQMQPARIADSRDQPTVDGLFRDTGPRSGASVWKIDVYPRRSAAGQAPIGAVLNITALNAKAPGFATIYPCTDEVPTASSLNYAPGGFEPNEVIAKLSDDGEICVYTHSTADIIVDLVAWVPGGSGYVPKDPTRLADSRSEPTIDGEFRDTGIRAGGTIWEVDIAGRGPIPNGATTVAVNLTVTGGTGPGFATVFPCTDDPPNASSVNYDVGVTRPNELVATLSPDGTLCVFVLADVHVILDVVGYVDTRVYNGVDPARFADSRDQQTIDGQFRDTGLRSGGTEWEIQIAGRAGVPAEHVQSAVVNVTVTGGTAPGFVTIYGCGSAPRPDTSSVNYVVGTTRPNEVLTSVSLDGTICVYTSADVHIIVDVVGYIATREQRAA